VVALEKKRKKKKKKRESNIQDVTKYKYYIIQKHICNESIIA